MSELALQIVELIEANIAEIKAKAEKEEISLKTCEKEADKLTGLKEQVIREWIVEKKEYNYAQ